MEQPLGGGKRRRAVDERAEAEGVSTIESVAKALMVAQIACGRQAEDLVVMDVRAISSIADFFVLCTADNARQIEALQEAIEASLAARGCSVGHTEGAMASARSPMSSGALRWVLMDCGDIIVHVFDRRARTFYRLDDLWADAPHLPLPFQSLTPGAPCSS